MFIFSVHFRKSQVNERGSIQFKGRFPCFFVLCIIMHVAGPLYILTNENNGDSVSVSKIRVKGEGMVNYYTYLDITLPQACR